MTNIGISKKARFAVLGGLVVGISAAMLVNSPTAVANGGNGIDVCHQPGTPAERVMNVPSAAVPAHLTHGDYLIRGGGGSSSAARSGGC